MHHGNFYSGESDERQRTRVWTGKGGGGGTGMIWLPWQNVQGHRSWHKASDIARMKYTDTCKNNRDKENYIFH